MNNCLKRFVLVTLGTLLVFSLCVMDAGAQSKKKRSRRTHKTSAPRPVITNPPIASPDGEQGGDVRIISTADENSGGESGSETKPATRKKPPSDSGQMQQTINSLSNQVDRLNDKLSKMQENDRAMLDMERLTRAEQRAESLRQQQLDTETKLADLQSRLDQIDFDLKPENIERAAAGYGSTRPEEAREARRRALESEKSRLQSQQRLLETSRARLEHSVATADAEVDLLRRRMDTKRQQEDAADNPPADGTAEKRKKPE